MDTNIGYDDLGRAFYDRINVLYVELFNTGPLLSAKTWDDWFNVDINKEALLDAETGIVKLERSGMARFKKL